MTYSFSQVTDDRYATCISNSKRIRWDIEDDVIRGREFDLNHKYLPDGLSRVDDLDFLSQSEQRFLSQIQGRTYANIFGLVERYIGAKMLELSQQHALENQICVEALVRFTEEELKHQALFRRIESMIARQMPDGYAFVPDPNEVARAVLSKSTWSVLALTCHIELFTQSHYRQSIDADETLSPLFKDVFLFHWKEESQHAILDELEWRREDNAISDDMRDRAVDDLIALVGAVDSIITAQASADAAYFANRCGRDLSGNEQERLEMGILTAYRWQYIVSGVENPRFARALGDMVNEDQMTRISTALAPIMASV